MLIDKQNNQKGTLNTSIKQPARLRNKEFLIRFTQEEFDELNYFIKKSGKTRADFFLDLIRTDKIVIIDDLSKTWVELQKQGNNINQIAKSIHALNIQIKENNIDEADIMRFTGYNGHRNAFSPQQDFLCLLENGEYTFTNEEKKTNTINLDKTLVLFQVLVRRLLHCLKRSIAKKQSLGFTSDDKSNADDKSELLSKTTLEDLKKLRFYE